MFGTPRTGHENRICLDNTARSSNLNFVIWYEYQSKHKQLKIHKLLRHNIRSVFSFPTTVSRTVVNKMLACQSR